MIGFQNKDAADTRRGLKLLIQTRGQQPFSKQASEQFGALQYSTLQKKEVCLLLAFLCALEKPERTAQ
jgi:hypothetical protein